MSKVPPLGPGFSAVYFLSIQDAEVLNGGFYQFFYNSGREAVLRAREGADLLGLPALAAATSRALEIEERERAKMARVKADGTIEAFFESYQEVSFEPADEAYLALDLKLSPIIIAFIRSHPDLFVGRASP